MRHRVAASLSDTGASSSGRSSGDGVAGDLSNVTVRGDDGGVLANALLNCGKPFVGALAARLTDGLESGRDRLPSVGDEGICEFRCTPRFCVGVAISLGERLLVLRRTGARRRSVDGQAVLCVSCSIRCVRIRSVTYTESCSSFQFFKLPLVFKLYLLKSLPVLELTLPMLLLQRNILLLSTVPVGSHDSNFTLLLLRPLTQFINQMLLLSLLCAQLASVPAVSHARSSSNCGC